MAGRAAGRQCQPSEVGKTRSDRTDGFLPVTGFCTDSKGARTSRTFCCDLLSFCGGLSQHDHEEPHTTQRPTRVALTHASTMASQNLQDGAAHAPTGATPDLQVHAPSTGVASASAGAAATGTGTGTAVLAAVPDNNEVRSCVLLCCSQLSYVVFSGNVHLLFCRSGGVDFTCSSARQSWTCQWWDPWLHDATVPT